MLIHQLAAQTGISTKAIRYYESIGLLPRPRRSANNYRQYTAADAERLRFIAGARRLGLTLGELAEILAAREAGLPPCDRVLDTLDHRIGEIDRRIADLLALREALGELRRQGEALPRDDVRGEHCVCYLVKAYSDTGQVSVER